MEDTAAPGTSTAPALAEGQTSSEAETVALRRQLLSALERQGAAPSQGEHLFLLCSSSLHSAECETFGGTCIQY